MKTLNQEELFFVSGGNSDENDNVPAQDETPAEVVVAERTFLQAAGAFLSKLAMGCCS